MAINVSPSLQWQQASTPPLVLRPFAHAGRQPHRHCSRGHDPIELWWNAARSPSLTAGQRERVLSRLRSRLTEDGELRVVASDTRSQARNKAMTIERFQALLAKALAVRKRRKPTRPPRAARERRLAEKRKQSERKRRRQAPGSED
jgi:ribosome-associated protein